MQQQVEHLCEDVMAAAIERCARTSALSVELEIMQTARWTLARSPPGTQLATAGGVWQPV